jgi:hypothetical protein
MVKIQKFGLILLMSMVILSGCIFPFSSSGATATPNMGSEPGLPSSLILFSDNFNGGKGSWRLIASSLGSKVAYEHQGLRVTVNEVNYAYWTTPGQQFGDVRISVSGSRMGGPNDNYFGVICRFQEPNNFYAFLISSDGYFGILKVKNGAFQLINGNNMEFSDKILQGRATNRIRGDCVGNKLTLFVNGMEVKSVEDSEFTTGDVGLIAGSHEIFGVDILFDDFVVYQP